MPFYRACPRGAVPKPVPCPARLPPALVLSSGALPRIPLAPRGAGPAAGWEAKIRAAWGEVSETAAHAELRDFIASRMPMYEKRRSAVAGSVVSKLSPFIRFGVLSARQVQHAIETAPLPREATKTIGRRLYWRDLAY